MSKLLSLPSHRFSGREWSERSPNVGPGRKAVGAILLAAVLCIAAALHVAEGSAARPAGRQDEDKRARLAYFVNSIPGSNAEAALAEYNRFMAENTTLTVENAKGLLAKMYSAAGEGHEAHKTVALLIKEGLSQANTSGEFNEAFNKGDFKYRQISEPDSVTLAKARDALIEEVTLKILEDHKADGWVVARSDSGNVKSGMKSDLDQTFYVYKIEDGKKVRYENLDKIFIDEFKTKWQTNASTKGISLGALDVVSIEGSSRFPDPRQVSLENYSKAFQGTISELRNVEGAYSTYGAQLQQVQQRIWDVLEESAGRAEPDNPRIFQLYGPDGDDVSKPCVKQQGFDFELARQTMFFAPPEIMKGHAFGAAIANFMFLQHYLHADVFDPKYHLRTFDDAMFTRQLLEMGQGRRWKQSIVDMNPNKRNMSLDKALDDMFGPGNAEKKQHHKLAMEVSMKQRLLHKAQKPEDIKAVFGDRPGMESATDTQKQQWLFEDLAKALYGDKYKPGENPQFVTNQQVRAAEMYHRRLANEFCLEAIYKTGGETFRLMKDPSIADSCRHLLGTMSDSDWDVTRKNMAKGAELTLLYSVYDMGVIRSLELMKRIDDACPGHRGELFTTWLRGQFQPLVGAYDNPDPYIRNVKQRLGELSERAKLHVLTEFGFERVPEGEVAHLILGNQRLSWSLHGLAKSMFWNPGSVDSLAQIILTYSESKGDVDAVMTKVADELFLAIPLVGQAESARRGGGVGIALMAWGMYHPAVGGVMLAYSFGSTCYTLYQVEIEQPYAGNLEDALYRGFAGPETVAYGEFGHPPPQWEPPDQAKLDQLKQELQLARPAAGPSGDTLTPGLSQEEFARQWEQYEQTRQRLDPQIQTLEAKKLAFGQYSEGAWLGGYITGYGFVPDQLWISDYLLRDVEPRYGFLTKGVIDLKGEFDPTEGEKRIKEIEKQIDKAKTSDELLELSAEHHELTLMKERAEQAGRYLEHVRDPRHKEMLYRFKRDSLARWVVDKKININSYVDQWFARQDSNGVTNEEKIAKELYKHGLIADTVWKYPNQRVVRGVGREPLYDERDRGPRTIVPFAIKDSLKVRMNADFERSQRLTNIYREQEKERRKKSKENLEKAKPLFAAETAGLYIDEMSKDQKLQSLWTAMRYAAIKRLTPKVEATIYKTLTDPKKSKGKPGEQMKQAFDLSVAVDVTTDPTLYIPPYNTKATVLTKGDLDSLSGDVQGVKLELPTISAIQSLRSEHSEEIADGNGLVAVVTTYASKVPDLSGAIKETLAGLPGIDQNDRSGTIVMGQQAAFVPVEPLIVHIKPVRVQVVDQTGQAIPDDERHSCVVTIGGEDAYSTGSEYWREHKFTKYDETLEILAEYTMPDGSKLTGNAKLSVNDINDWINPQPLPDPIPIKLPIYRPGAFTLTGAVKARAPADDPYPGLAGIKNELLSVDETVAIPGGEQTLMPDGGFRLGVIEEAAQAVFGTDGGPQDGSFRISVDAPVRAGEAIRLTFIGATTKGRFQAVKAVPPAAPGIVDFGTVTMTPVTTKVPVPPWDRENPPDYQAYAQKLSGVGLAGRPKLGDLPEQAKFEYKVADTDPSSGTQVAPGTEVVVTIFGKYARKVPDVVGLNIQTATEVLKDQGFQAKQTLGDPADSKKKEFTVASQSPKPDTEVTPEQPINLVVFAQYVPSCVVPKLVGLTEKDAKERLEKAKLRMEVADRQKATQKEDEKGAIYKQEPQADSKVGADEKVKVWVYAGKEPAPTTTVTGPYYAVFQFVWPNLKDSGVPKVEKGENESDEAYKKRVMQTIESIPLNRVKWEPTSSEEGVFVIHVSNDALKKYPNDFFTENGEYACKVVVDARDPKTKQAINLTGALLLKSLAAYGSLDQVLDAYPVLKTKEQLKATAFTSGDGIAKRTENEASLAIGPINKGWSDADKKEALRFVGMVASMFSCYVATTVYPAPMSHEVEVLREFRDEVLLRSAAGRHLAEVYYIYGPRMAMLVMRHPEFEPLVRRSLDKIVLLLERFDTKDPVVRLTLDVAIYYCDMLVSSFVPENRPVIEQFQQALIRSRLLRNRSADEHSQGRRPEHSDEERLER